MGTRITRESGSDATLVKRAVEGDAEAFRALVEKYQDAVFGVALSRTGSAADSEEVAQETFLAAFNSLDTLRDPGSFGHWVYGIACNKARMFTRAQRARRRAHERASEAVRAAAAGRDREQDSQQALVHEALERLPGVNREAATLFYINGYSVADIAQFTNRPAGTIKRRLHDARQGLRKELLTMTENQLKRDRPGKVFTDAVLRKIRQVRVHLSGREANTLLLTDGRKRSFLMVIGQTEAEALAPWLAGKGSADAPDAYAALLRMLDSFDVRIEEVTITELKHHVFLAKLSLRAGKRTRKVDCRPSDGINLAVRAGAVVLAHKDVADECLMTDEGGKALSPGKAWGQVLRERPPFTKRSPFFENIAQVIETLKANPEADRARMALQQAWPDFHYRPPMVGHVGDGMGQLHEWVKQSRGADMEAVASGLLGSVYLYTARQVDRALPYLERAHALCPGDDRIAFDLATACARSGDADRAFDILKNDKLTVFGKNVRVIARNCGNFQGLWDDPRFGKLLGKPEPRWRVCYLEAQTGIRHWARTPEEHGDKANDWRKAIGLVPAVVGPQDGPFDLPCAPADLAGRVEGRLDCGPTAPVEAVWFVPDEKRTRRCRLLCLIRPNRAAMLSLREGQAMMIGSVLGEPPRPMTAQTFAACLRACRITLDAAVLVKRRRWGVEGALLVHSGRRRASICLEGSAALAIAATAGRPVLITNVLAEKLYVRGESGRALSFSGTMRRLSMGRNVAASPLPAMRRRKVIRRSKAK